MFVWTWWNFPHTEITSRFSPSANTSKIYPGYGCVFLGLR
ncbi:hypothetical protein B6N60_04637 [Richelia sinica FACHB-800]|uniref:Uncharacterized protein n=1 Tax=Richelia sinica FACHB-800 TaxID=1357546 RepID=A0A975TDF8_9NOST|nr:hypothetical protein B6N60_04637 [Richelia sinica FACHB-800]